MYVYFEKERSNNPVVNYCLKNLTNVTFNIAFYVLDDVVEEMASLYKIVQKSNLPLQEPHHLTTEKISKDRNQCLPGDAHRSERVNALLEKKRLKK